MKMVRLALSVLMTSHLILLANHSTYASANVKEAETMQQVESAFNEIVNLWHEQKFDELYDRFVYKDKGTISKGKFINRMTKEKKKLACCWQKVQDVKIKIYSSGKAEVKAKFGFEDQSNEITYIATEIPLYLKHETWMAKVKDMLDTAPDAPKYKTKKHTKK